MKNLIEQLIVDFQGRKLPDILLREASLPQISGKIDTVIGMRRTGKTWFLYQKMQDLLNQNVSKKNLLYINFDDERLLPVESKQLSLIPETYYQLFPECKQEKCYFFFDEIQNVPAWEAFVRRLLDTENIHLFLTGSSAKLLSKEIATSLRGRAIATEIFPFSFRETFIYENPDISLSHRPDANTRALLANRFRKYLLKGGFPEVQSISEEYRIRILQEYVDVVILRDIVERYKTPNVQVLRILARSLLGAPASSFTVNKFYNDLRSQGISCTKNMLYDYLDHLQDAYLIYPITIHHRSERVRRTNPKKMYVIDSGLVQAFLHQPLNGDWGRLLENVVYMELRRKGLNVEYYRTAENTEVDFLTTSLRGERNLYQVALTIQNTETRGRELRALEAAMKEMHLKTGFIITLDERETIQTKSGLIEVIPVWDWCVYSSVSCAT